ncbi:MAG: class I SAM-dependent methyltransferase [Nitrospira sp.]|nr:class I SAM-dependent methyltransferase [Nitrospira sp.]
MLTRKEARHALVGPVKNWKTKRDFQIRFLKAMGLAPDHYLLDIGCGTLRGGIPLIKYLRHSHYCGIDVRKQVLDEGRKELQESGLGKKHPVLLHVTDISQLMMDRKYDYIWAFAVLIHMSDDILHHTLACIKKYLADGGVCYANVNVDSEGGGGGSYWHEFPLVWRPYEFYNRACSRNHLVLTDLGPLKNYGDPVATQDTQRMVRITLCRDMTHVANI